MEGLSESLENYLRIIYEVQSLKDFARVKDITSRLNVKTASVADALKKLGEQGLVDHKKYAYIKLTQEGIHVALKVYQKHQSILRFLTDVMFMKDDEASEELACGLEHHLNAELFLKMEELTDFFNENAKVRRSFKKFLELDTPLKGKKLNEALAGTEIKVIKLGGTKSEKDKLLSMGILPGMKIMIQENDLTSELMRVKLRGFSVNISHEDAKKVMIKVL